MKSFLILIYVALLSGCSVLTDLSEQTSEVIASSINTYCESGSKEAREIIRDNINSDLKEGNSIHIRCAGD